MEKMFEKATREKLRFSTVKGAMPAEALWEIPLTSKDGFNLDSITKAVKKDLDASKEESYVKKTSPSSSLHELRFEILKYVISVRLDESEAREKAAEKKAQKEKIMEILSRKQDEALESKTEDQLKKLLASL
jgi:hypothetical protein